jgi:hypothetical protein
LIILAKIAFHREKNLTKNLSLFLDRGASKRWENRASLKVISKKYTPNISTIPGQGDRLTSLNHP